MKYDEQLKALDNLPKDPAQLQQLGEIIGGKLGVACKAAGVPEGEVVNRFQSGFHSGYIDPNWTPGGDTVGSTTR